MFPLSISPILFLVIFLDTSVAALPNPLGAGLERVETTTLEDAGRQAPRLDRRLSPRAARVGTTRITDQKYRAGVMRRERKERQLGRETLRERADSERRRQARVQRGREARRARRARRALHMRVKKKRRLY